MARREGDGDPRGPLKREKAAQQVLSYYVITPDGDRPFPWRSISPGFEAALPPGSRVYEVESYVAADDKVGDAQRVTMRRIK